MEKNLILKLNKYVLKRFEENINDEGGIMFLYNTKTNVYWSGSPSSRFLIRQFDGIKTIEQIYDKLHQDIFFEYDKKEMENSFNQIITELCEKNFLENV